MQIKLDKNTITPELKRLMSACKSPVVVMQAGAKAVQVGISKHLKQLQGRGNEKGWPSKQFFAGGPTSVERKVGIKSVTGTSAEITIADPRFVHRITGGKVSAKRVKFLAIPLTAEAYAAGGKGSIREAMPGLKVVRSNGGLFLAKEASGKRGTKAQVQMLFKLVASVTHRPHPDEMPDEKALGAAARVAMERAARLLMRGTGQ